MSIPFENLSFNETVLIQQFWGARWRCFFVLYFSTASNRVSGNASISSTLQNQVRYKDLQVNLQRDLMVCDFEFQLQFFS
jgi:hypothetical protein